MPGTPEEYAQLNQQKEVRGKLVTRDPDLDADPKVKKNLIFRYEYEATEANPNYKPTKGAHASRFHQRDSKSTNQQNECHADSEPAETDSRS